MAKKLRILTPFKKDYKKLPDAIKAKADKQLKLLLENPGHPSLNLHSIRGTKGIWEGYIDYHYRFTFELEDLVKELFYSELSVISHDFGW